MFGRNFVMVSALLITFVISLKAHGAKRERFAGKICTGEKSVEGTEGQLIKSLTTNEVSAARSKRSPKPSPVKHRDLAMAQSLGEAICWPRGTIAFPPQDPFDMQQRREMLLSRRSSNGKRFYLSLDVPTNILSNLIDLARAKSMRAKAAANAELMERIGK